MKKSNVISALALSAILGTALALPATVSAHEVVKEKRVKVIKTHERRDHHRGDMDHWYVERHHEVSSRWAPPRRGHKHRHHHKRHGHGPHHQRHERRGYRDYRPVERHDHRRHDNDSVRVRIDYDLWL